MSTDRPRVRPASGGGARLRVVGAEAVRLLLLGMACLAVCASPSFAAEEAEEKGPIIRRIDVFGAVTISPEEVKRHMGSREGRPLDRETLEEDFQRLFRMGTFADVQIKEEPVEGGVRLILLLREKDIIRRISFRGAEQVAASRLRDLVESQVGERFDWGQVNRDARAIEDWYQEEYYYFADVTPKAEPFEDGVQLVFEIDEGGRLYVRKIIFRGNYHIRDKELLKFMETQSSGWFLRGKYDRATFEKDLERLRLFYQSKGYLDARIIERPFQVTSNVPQSRWQRREAYIYIDIEEGEQYRVGRVEFEGNRLVEDEALRGVVQTMPGGVFSPLQAREDASKIRDIYGLYPSSRYFTNVQAERVLTEEGPIVDVVFHIEEGDEVVVEDVQILGLSKTKDFVVRREIDLLPGEKIDSAKINEAERRLRNLGYFSRIDFDVKEGSAGDRAKLVVDLEEQPTGKFVIGAGVSSRENFIGSVELNQRNFDYRNWPSSWSDFLKGTAFAGAGQRFSLKASRGSKSQTYTLDFTNPWIFNRPIRFGFGGQYWGYEWSDYTEKRAGGHLRLGRRLWNKDLDGSVTYKLERVTLEDFAASVPLTSPLRAEEGSNWVSRVIFNLTYDTRDNVFDPTKGIFLSATQEFAGGFLGGDKDFWRSFVEAKFFHPVFKDWRKLPWVIALRGDIGVCGSYGDDDEVPVYERMYAGGIGSVRGFEHHTISPRAFGDEIGGNLRATMSAEFFIPVWEDTIKVSGFYDTGAVFEERHFGSENLWRSSVGAGLHVKTPLSPMPVRLYFAKILDEVQGDDEEKFQFSFGAFF